MKNILLLMLCVFAFEISMKAQVICVFCYYQNEALNPGATNLIVNGGFESHGNGTYYCPGSYNYDTDIANWTCTNGGTDTYAQILDNNYSFIPEGDYVAYMGNYFCNACSNNVDDTSCLQFDSCIVAGVPSGYPVNTTEYGGTLGVSLSQTVSGLIVGAVYILEFWSGGENGFVQNGIFAVDVGFGNNFVTCHRTPTDGSIPGKRFMIVFRPTATSHTIKFTNWGHICDDCTEAILDDVQLYTLADAVTHGAPCFVGPVFHDTTANVILCEGETYAVNGHAYSVAGTYHDTTYADTLNPIVQTTNLSFQNCIAGVVVPNAFSPNGDGVNDVFHAIKTPEGIVVNRMTVYNRWGQIVFQSAGNNADWDGRFEGEPQEIGVYVYVIDYTMTATGEVKELKGNVSLVR